MSLFERYSWYQPIRLSTYDGTLQDAVSAAMNVLGQYGLDTKNNEPLKQ